MQIDFFVEKLLPTLGFISISRFISVYNLLCLGLKESEMHLIVLSCVADSAISNNFDLDVITR